MGIGYGRAARLIDFMAEDGIVGTYNGSQAREVLITLEQWAEMLGQQPTPESPKPPKRNRILPAADEAPFVDGDEADEDAEPRDDDLDAEDSDAEEHSEIEDVDSEAEDESEDEDETDADDSESEVDPDAEDHAGDDSDSDAERVAAGDADTFPRIRGISKPRQGLLRPR